MSKRLLFASVFCVMLCACSFLLYTVDTGSNVVYVNIPSTDYVIQSVTVRDKETVKEPIERTDKIAHSLIFDKRVEELSRLFPVKLSLVNTYVDSTRTFCVENSDIYIDTDADGNISRIYNRYGPDYPLVYYTNGVPDNAVDVYRCLRQHGITDMVKTNYTDGFVILLETLESKRLIYMK